MKGKTPRAICLDILNRVEKTDRHPDQLLTDSFKQYRHLTPIDRAFLTELVYGVLRWRGKLDWALARFSSIPLEKIEGEVIQILRIGLYQIFFLSRTPVSAAVNESVEMAKRFRGKGGAGFVNGVLRSILREKEEIAYPERSVDPPLHISVVQSHPLWLVKRWMNELGEEETLRCCAANQRHAPLVLRANTLKTGREDLIQGLAERGLEPLAAPHAPEGIVLKDPPAVSDLPFLKEGLYILQDEASQMVTSILDPRPGETVLDACAAPGGKTTHIGQRMKNEGEIVAVDLTRDKLKLIEEGVARLGVRIVKTVRGDATRAFPFPGRMMFDRVLADVPCSGFGTLRKNPDLKWRKGEDDIRRMGELQSSILSNLSRYVKSGGILVYSTCTVFHEENEDVVERFLGEHSDFRVDPLDSILPPPFARGGYFKTFPPRDGMDGFFAARLVRNS